MIGKFDGLGALVAQSHTNGIAYVVRGRVYSQLDAMRQEGVGKCPFQFVDLIGLGLSFGRGICGQTDTGCHDGQRLKVGAPFWRPCRMNNRQEHAQGGLYRLKSVLVVWQGHGKQGARLAIERANVVLAKAAIPLWTLVAKRRLDRAIDRPGDMCIGDLDLPPVTCKIISSLVTISRRDRRSSILLGHDAMLLSGVSTQGKKSLPC